MMERLMTATTSTTPAAPLLLRPRQAAALLGISVGGLYNLLNAGTVPSVKLGDSRRIPLASLEALISRLLDEAQTPNKAA
jgi:excisionase family DNA binding protein